MSEGRFFEALWWDVCYALRAMRENTLFSTVVVVGMIAGLALTRVMRDLLFQVSPTDPATFIGVSLLFVVVALLASYIPARRAAGIDPLVTLRI
jgi:ABC-type lipoprotein release transport system permease subunit